MVLNILVASYVIALLLNYFLLRRNYVRNRFKTPMFVLVLSIIPILNILVALVSLWIEIEETITYERFLQFIFFAKNKD